MEFPWTDLSWSSHDLDMKYSNSIGVYSHQMLPEQKPVANQKLHTHQQPQTEMTFVDPGVFQMYVDAEHEEYDDTHSPLTGSLVWASDGTCRQTCRLHQLCTERNMGFRNANCLQRNSFPTFRNPCLKKHTLQRNIRHYITNSFTLCMLLW
jgi:hypothetical protein